LPPHRDWSVHYSCPSLPPLLSGNIADKNDKYNLANPTWWPRLLNIKIFLQMAKKLLIMF